MPEHVETVVVGGGQSGLAMSYWLTRHGREHLILEQGRLNERWRSQRWDSLHFQFPRWSLQLPGHGYQGDDPDGFAHRDEVVSFLETYAASFGAPIRTGVRVREIRHLAESGHFVVGTSGGAFEARNVVVATGVWQQPVTPKVSTGLPGNLCQLHSADYRHPGQLPPGAVFVVGSSASGCQITEDLVSAGRNVYLSVGAPNRVPRRYRGRDFTWWGLLLAATRSRSTNARPAASTRC